MKTLTGTEAICQHLRCTSDELSTLILEWGLPVSWTEGEDGRWLPVVDLRELRQWFARRRFSDRGPVLNIPAAGLGLRTR